MKNDLSRQRNQWSSAEDRMLRYLRSERKMPTSEIAAVLGRSEQSVAKRLNQLGLSASDRVGAITRTRFTGAQAEAIWKRMLQGEDIYTIGQEFDLVPITMRRLRSDLLMEDVGGDHRKDRRAQVRQLLSNEPALVPAWEAYMRQNGKIGVIDVPTPQPLLPKVAPKANGTEEEPSFEPKAAVVALASKLLEYSRRLATVERRLDGLIMSLGGIGTENKETEQQ